MKKIFILIITLFLSLAFTQNRDCYDLSEAHQHLKDEYEWAYEEWNDEED